MDQSLQSIAESLKVLASGSIFGGVLATLPAAIVGAAAAIGAAWATSYFTTRNSATNAMMATLIEVRVIADELDRIVKIPSGHLAVPCPLIALRYEAFPVFRAAAQHLVKLDDDRARRMFAFFADFNTVPAASDAGLFYIEDIRRLANLARSCL